MTESASRDLHILIRAPGSRDVKGMRLGWSPRASHTQVDYVDYLHVFGVWESAFQRQTQAHYQANSQAQRPGVPPEPNTRYLWKFATIRSVLWKRGSGAAPQGRPRRSRRHAILERASLDLWLAPPDVASDLLWGASYVGLLREPIHHRAELLVHPMLQNWDICLFFGWSTFARPITFCRYVLPVRFSGQ